MAEHTLSEPGGDIAAGSLPPVSGSVAGAFRQWLAGLDAAGLSDRERIELVAELERVKGASSAAQARLVHAVRRSREEQAPQDVARSVGSEVALARHESPWSGDRFVRTAMALVDEMPRTMAALAGGECSEGHAVTMVTATSMLSSEGRSVVDQRVGPLLGRLGLKHTDQAARRVAAEVDAAAVLRRMEAAVASRRVTMRAAADGMAYLTVLGPMTEVVGAHQSLTARARSVVAGQAPDEPHAGRGVGAVAADTALRVLSGRQEGQLQPVEVHLVMTDRSLLGIGDPTRSEFEPARLPGHGPVPAPVARWWLRDAGPGSAWLRRLFTSPDGRQLVAMDSRRRTFPGLLRRMLVLRDDLCTTPYCGAAIVHADHATPAREGGRTSFAEGNGKCARCNQTKEAQGWRTEVRDRSARGRGRHHDAELPTERDALRRLVIRTPLGRVHESEPPPLLGWGGETSTRGQAHTTSPLHLPDPVARGRKRRLSSRRAAARHLSGHRGRRRPLARSHLERELCRLLT